MFFALDDDGKKVNILSAEKGKRYYCPCCKQELIQKNGAKVKVKIPPFLYIFHKNTESAPVIRLDSSFIFHIMKDNTY